MHFFGNYSFGLIFMVAALVHFARRRPDWYWLWIIIMGGGVGAIVYLIVEALPDVTLLRQLFGEWRPDPAYFWAPERPGLGITMSPEYVREHSVDLATAERG